MERPPYIEHAYKHTKISARNYTKGRNILPSGVVRNKKRARLTKIAKKKNIKIKEGDSIPQKR